MKICLISLGCVKNLVDSENVLAMLQKAGHHLVTIPEEADLIVINTCGFITSAKQESIDYILAMLAYQKRVVVIGCLVERYLQDLREEIPEVDLFVPLRDYHQLHRYLEKLIADEKTIPAYSTKARVYSTPASLAYLKISEGCDHRCRYCAIPDIRGPFRSYSVEDVLFQADNLEKAGVKELVLIGQNTTGYGEDLPGDVNLINLLKELLKFKGFVFIRLLYLYPAEVDEELVTFIKANPRIVPYFDLPIQHSANRIRKRMGRVGTREELLNKIAMIRRLLPQAVLRTTVMLGFPGEQEKDQDDLLNFIKEVEFDHLGAFTYSREENTPAYDDDHQVPEVIKIKRYQAVMQTQKTISYQKNQRQIGKIHQGLVIGYNQDKNLYYLRSFWNAPDGIDGKITFSSDIPLFEGEVVKVKITQAYVYDLHGELIVN
ncbi:MAG: 30S ribosomal protein S12 methylthiotransferase RimO [Bacilli bacterium]